MARVATRALFSDRRDAGRALAHALGPDQGRDAVVVGLARGGVVVAAQVAAELGLPLDAVAVRKIRHPWQPEYAIGAVTPGDGVYVRAPDGLTPAELQHAVDSARVRAAELDARLHRDVGPIGLRARTCILVDDGLATGATMIAAVRWARTRGAARIVAAIPVGASSSVSLLEDEADAVVCPNALDEFRAVGVWYDRFDPVEDTEVEQLLADSARREPSP
jgi:putative phosphoribosyl transferase